MRIWILVISLLAVFVAMMSIIKEFGKLNKDSSKIYAYLIIWTIFWELFMQIVKLITRG